MFKFPTYKKSAQLPLKSTLAWLEFYHVTSVRLTEKNVHPTYSCGRSDNCISSEVQ